MRLVAGTYKIGSPIVVANFSGTLAGAGASHTTMTCTDPYSYELWEAGGSVGEPPPPFPRASVDDALTKTPPVLIQFYKMPLGPGESPAERANRIVIRDLRCRGAMIGEPWAFGNEVLCFNISNSTDWQNESAPETTRQDVVVRGVEVDGYRTAAFAPFDVACACITVLGGAITTSDYDLTGDRNGDGLGFTNGGLLISSTTPSTYCFHLVDLANLAFGAPTLRAAVQGNSCQDSETCIGLEHIDGGRVVDNRCTSQAFGVELHNSTRAIVRDNEFDLPVDVDGCEVRILELGEKIDLSRVRPEAGICMLQG